MLSKILTATTVMLSPMAIFGVGMLVGAASPDKLPAEMLKKFTQAVGVWSKVVGQEIPATVFFSFFGTCQLSGVLALWGLFGSTLSKVANACFLIHLSGAVYTRMQLKEDLMPPLASLGIALVRLVAALAASTPSDKGKKA
mmetsp:Transcript_8243/g.18831  ORF Transcript_8243/g.18831 Transcript_8243/m.18831 type:complete len:141 (-) Transcript_8243:130-552(-)